jgi:hypothetical protein
LLDEPASRLLSADSACEADIHPAPELPAVGVVEALVGLPPAELLEEAADLLMLAEVEAERRMPEAVAAAEVTPAAEVVVAAVAAGIPDAAFNWIR